MVKFPQVDPAGAKREIFNFVNKKEIELLMQKHSYAIASSPVPTKHAKPSCKPK
jgi:hypothetical protein